MTPQILSKTFLIDKHKNTGIKYGQKLIPTVRRVRKVADPIRNKINHGKAGLL